MQAITLTSNSHKFLNFFTWKIKIINFKNSDFCKLLRLPISPILKNQWFHLGMLIFFAKIFLILYPWPWNSITGNAKILMYILSYNFIEFEFAEIAVEINCIYSGPCALQLWSEENLQGRTYRVHNWHFPLIFKLFQIKSLQNYGDCCWNIFR